MLKIRNKQAKEKYTEINIRHRIYQEQSYITLMILTEFYPTLVNEQLVSGSIEAKVDMKDINSLDDLVGKKLDGDIGSVTLSIYNDGIWEHQSQDKFKIKINKRNKRELELSLVLEDVELDTIGTIVSLYTTSTSKEELLKSFNLKDFYEKPTEKEIANKNILKYFTKE